MNHISKCRYITIQGETWRVYSKKRGYFTQMLRSMLDQLLSMISHHNKLLVLRLDLHQHEQQSSNRRITEFNRRFFDLINTHYEFTRIGYIWAREQNKANAPHYHYALFLDGNKVQHPHYLIEMAMTVWEFMDGTIWVPANSYYKLSRQDSGVLQRVIFRISYLAKGIHKNHKSLTGKNYGTSKIKWNH
jgi:hypothetical protein